MRHLLVSEMCQYDEEVNEMCDGYADGWLVWPISRANSAGIPTHHTHALVDIDSSWSRLAFTHGLSVHSVYSDEDMQSVASLMSMGKADIGNLEDLEEDDEEEAAAGESSRQRQVAQEISSLANRMQQLGNPFEEDEEEDSQLHDDYEPALNPFGECRLPFHFSLFGSASLSVVCVVCYSLVSTMSLIVESLMKLM